MASKCTAVRSQSSRRSIEKRYEFDPGPAGTHSSLPKCRVVAVEVAVLDAAVEVWVDVADDDRELDAVLETELVADEVADEVPVDVSVVEPVVAAVLLAVVTRVELAVDDAVVTCVDVPVDDALEVWVELPVVVALEVAVSVGVVLAVLEAVEVAVVTSQLKKPVPLACASKSAFSAVTVAWHSARPCTKRVLPVPHCTGSDSALLGPVNSTYSRVSAAAVARHSVAVVPAATCGSASVGQWSGATAPPHVVSSVV
jgi:hypothetical protein